MSGHHDNHDHSNEHKPVSFTVPFILAVVTLTAILLLVSLGDPCHCKETCDTEHAKEAHGGAHDAKHHEEHAAPATGHIESAEHAEEAKADTATVKEIPAAPVVDEHNTEPHH